MKRFLRMAVAKFARDSKGSATVETVLWLPLFFLAFGLMTDVAMIFNGHSQVMRVVQDANRNRSVGRLEADAQVVEYVVQSLSAIAPNASATSSITAGVVTTVVTVPATDLEVLGLFTALNELNLTITSQQYVEF